MYYKSMVMVYIFEPLPYLGFKDSLKEDINVSISYFFNL